MKIIVFTTNTTHHIYFIKKISQFFNIDSIILEKESLIPQFNTDHPFEKERDSYEKIKLLNEEKLDFGSYSKTIELNNINDPECIDFISKQKPDVVISFGTGIIRNPIIEKCKNGIINLHGGDPQYYRGLDSHLWAIYHKEFSHLKVCLHRVNRTLDDGEIIDLRSIKIRKDLELFMLRSENTRLCVEITLSALKKFEGKGIFKSKPQKSKGRYYSFMPDVLKEVCLKYFKQHTKSL